MAGAAYGPVPEKRGEAMDNNLFFLSVGVCIGMLIGYIVHVLTLKKSSRKKNGYTAYRRQRFKENLRLYMVMFLIAAAVGWVLILINEKASTIPLFYNRGPAEVTIPQKSIDTLDKATIDRLVKEYREKKKQLK